MDGTSSARPRCSRPLLKHVLSPSPLRTASCGSQEGKCCGQLLLRSCLAGTAAGPSSQGGPEPHLPVARGPGCSVVWTLGQFQAAQRQPPPAQVTLWAHCSPDRCLRRKKGPLLFVTSPQKHLSHSLHIDHGKASVPQPGREKVPFSSVWLHSSQHKSSALANLILVSCPTIADPSQPLPPTPAKVTGLSQFHFSENMLESLSYPMCHGGQLTVPWHTSPGSLPPRPLPWLGLYFLIKALAAWLTSASQHQ